MKTFIYIIIALVACVGAFFILNKYIYNEKQGDTSSSTSDIIKDTDNLPKGEMGENPEGEADPDRMTLDMTVWNWISVTDPSVGRTLPKKVGVFTLTFKKDGTFAATTDCNGMFGKYSAAGKNISFSNIASTKMFCEESQEAVFTAIFENVASYAFSSRGELIFTLKNGGAAVFR
jgi:heat shock protein HslJ